MCFQSFFWSLDRRTEIGWENSSRFKGRGKTIQDRNEYRVYGSWPDDELLRLVGVGPVAVILLEVLLGLVHHHLGAVDTGGSVKHAPEETMVTQTLSRCHSLTTQLSPSAASVITQFPVWNRETILILRSCRNCIGMRDLRWHHVNISFLPWENFRPKRDHDPDQDVIARRLEVEKVVDEVLDHLHIVTVPEISIWVGPPC